LQTIVACCCEEVLALARKVPLFVGNDLGGFFSDMRNEYFRTFGLLPAVEKRIFSHSWYLGDH
jgi:hypothetical protein